MPIFKMIARSAAVALTVASMTCVAATAQAQSAKRLAVAMATPSSALEAKPVHTSAPAMNVPRAKRVAATVAPATSRNPDCFWCNRKVYISGLTF